MIIHTTKGKIAQLFKVGSSGLFKGKVYIVWLLYK